MLVPGPHPSPSSGPCLTSGPVSGLPSPASTTADRNSGSKTQLDSLRLWGRLSMDETNPGTWHANLRATPTLR